FYSTNCDVNGIDLANAEASVILQAFPWFEGTAFNTSWDTFAGGPGAPGVAALPQPGTVDALLQGVGVDVPNKPGKNNTLVHIKAGDISEGSVASRPADHKDDGRTDTVMTAG